MAVLLCDTRDDPVREQHYLRNLVARRVDGIILTGRRTEPRPALAVPLPVPVVHVFTPSADPAAASVVVDDAAGARLAAEHLLDLGRRRIALITGPQRHRTATARAEAAVAAITAGGGSLAGPVRYGDWSERWGRHAAASLLRRGPDVDAIACGSDQIARGVCDGLREAGRRVPEDVAVTGYDNWDVMALASRPPLTTVDLLLEELGRCAAGFLLDAIAGNPHPASRPSPRGWLSGSRPSGIRGIRGLPGRPKVAAGHSGLRRRPDVRHRRTPDAGETFTSREAAMSARGLLGVVGTAVGGLIGWTDEPPPPADPGSLRELFADLGVRVGPAAGDLDAAVRAFQARVGLAVDGVAGPRTVHQLARYAKEARDLRPFERPAA